MMILVVSLAVILIWKLIRAVSLTVTSLWFNTVHPFLVLRLNFVHAHRVNEPVYLVLFVAAGQKFLFGHSGSFYEI